MRSFSALTALSCFLFRNMPACRTKYTNTNRHFREKRPNIEFWVPPFKHTAYCATSQYSAFCPKEGKRLLLGWCKLTGKRVIVRSTGVRLSPNEQRPMDVTGSKRSAGDGIYDIALADKVVMRAASRYNNYHYHMNGKKCLACGLPLWMEQLWSLSSHVSETTKAVTITLEEIPSQPCLPPTPQVVCKSESASSGRLLSNIPNDT